MQFSSKGMRKFVVFCVSFFFFSFLLSKVSSAATVTFEAVMCNVYNLFSGTWGKIFAVFALVALGISFFLGKISWGTVLAVAIGIALIFGGMQIVETVLGTGSGLACSN
jgi:type IV secretory pathway VirB2 component (pilin)